MSRISATLSASLTMALVLLISNLCVRTANAVEDILGAPVPLPTDVQRLVDKASTDCAKIEAKAHDDENKLRTALVQELNKAQVAATKRGSLDDALVIKEEIERQEKVLGAVEQKKAIAAKTSTGSLLDGTFNFSVPGGFSGQIVIAGDQAIDLRSKYTGSIKISGNSSAPIATIHWSNDTFWTITMVSDNKFSLDTRDGPGKIEKSLSNMNQSFDIEKFILGKWKRTGGQEYLCEFNADGTCAIGALRGNWKKTAVNKVLVNHKEHPDWFTAITVSETMIVSGIKEDGVAVSFSRIP